MLKQALVASSLSWAMLGGVAQAEQIPLQITVEAKIPSDNFYVTPVGGWADGVQTLAWDPAAKSLATLRKNVDMKSSLGAIQGYLEQAASLYNGKDTIALNVRVAEKKLDVGVDKKVEVMSATDAAAGKRVVFELAPQKPTDGFKAGQYNGVVNLMFESVTPPAPPPAI